MRDHEVREGDSDRDERRPRRTRRHDHDRSERAASKDVSVLGVIALVKGVLALIVSLIPCFGAFAIFAAVIALVLAVTSVVVARGSRHGTGIPIAATVVSSSAVAFSLIWLAMFGVLFRGEERFAYRPPPTPEFLPAPLPPRTGSKPAPVQPKKADPKLTDEEYQKQVLEEIAKDRIKEAIRNGPGLPVSAENLDAEFQSNVIAAELKYKDKVLEVTGKVARVTRETGQTTVTLELVSGEGTKTVNCTFAEKAKYTLAQAERGQNITVRGLCTGRINKVVQLKDCVVAK